MHGNTIGILVGWSRCDPRQMSGDRAGSVPDSARVIIRQRYLESIQGWVWPQIRSAREDILIEPTFGENQLRRNCIQVCLGCKHNFQTEFREGGKPERILFMS